VDVDSVGKRAKQQELCKELHCFIIDRCGKADLYYITRRSGESVHLSDASKPFPRRVEFLNHTFGCVDPIVDFFIEHPNAQWLIAELKKVVGLASWKFRAIAWEE
jgi:hypothetical protein